MYYGSFPAVVRNVPFSVQQDYVFIGARSSSPLLVLHRIVVTAACFKTFVCASVCVSAFTVSLNRMKG